MEGHQCPSTHDLLGLGLDFTPQKLVLYNKLLPYSRHINQEIVEQLREIKENLSKAALLQDLRQGCVHWVIKLSRFVTLYGLCFSKEDHVRLVKLMYELAVTQNQEYWVTAKFAHMLTTLLKKKELLSPDDLILEWRPLYDLYNSLFYSSYSTIGMMMAPITAEGTVENMIRVCRFYFPPNATEEILKEVRPMLCPFDMMMQRAIVYLELFLPTKPSPCQEDCRWALWKDEMLSIWNTCHSRDMWFWEDTMFWLFARLAWHNIGFIAWEEHLPMVFTKVLRSFKLPVSYKKIKVTKRDGFPQFASAMFIVANLGGNSKTQEHLSRLFKCLESYYHPSNSDRWTIHLNDFLNKLSLLFIRRLHRERYKKPSWEIEVPTEKKLTEDDITAFVRCIQTPAMLSMHSPHTGAHDACTVFHRMSLLRPELIVPPLLEQLYSSLETTTEPHSLTASLECVVYVARALVQGGKHYPQGQTHVIPLLMQTLPGIDPNDIKKCMVTFQFLCTLVKLVPLVDCSAATEEFDDLTELEQEVCLQTARFEDFVLQFMDRCFALIENSTLEQITQQDRETEKMNLEENMLEMGLSSTYFAILSQAHPKIYETALEHLQTFISGKMIEIHVAGKLAANMCRSAVKVDPPKALKAFVPGVCRLLLTLTDNTEVQSEEHLDDEVLFNLLLLSELVRCSGCHLQQYIPQITKVLSQTLHLKSREGYHLAGSILRYLLKYLSSSTPAEYRSLPNPWDAPFSACLPIRHWGEAGDVHNLGLTWVEPTHDEEAAMQTLVQTFLIPELTLLHAVATGDKEVTREQLQQSLSITYNILLGGGAVLPHWKEEPITLVDMAVKRDSSKFIIRNQELCVTLESEYFPSNVRKAVADVILELVERLLSEGSDDTKSLCKAVNIYQGLIFFYGVIKEDFDVRWKGFQFIKNSLANKLTRHKQHIRSLLIERAVLHQESRTIENVVTHITETHRAIMTSLLNLSTSQYSEVRSKSQQILSQIFRSFPYSYKLILPGLITCLQVNPTEQHEKFKGSLYLLMEPGKSLMVRRDWETLNMIWPALISSQHSEKPSIIKLMNNLSRIVGYYMELIAIYHHIPDGVFGAAESLLQSNSPKVKDSVLSEEALSAARENVVMRGKSNHQLYKKLVMSLADHLQSGALHWRTHDIALNLLGCLVRPDVVFPAAGVRAFTSNLIHDNIRIRETSVYYMPWILKNQKRKHKKVGIDPYSVCGKHEVPTSASPGDNRPDNQWMQYKSRKGITTEEEWEELCFVEKTYHGWYTWPKTLMVYAPPSQQPPLDRTREELTQEERELYDFFVSQENVDKLVSFFSLEENKEKDFFSDRRYWTIKGLFRNFGDRFLPLFVGHLERLVNETQKSSQRCAAEIINGIIRGSKHWTFAKNEAMWSELKPILRTAIANVTVETVGDWGTCVANISADRDPNKLSPLLELLMDDPLRAGEGAFNGSSRLYMLMRVLGEQQWRVSKLNHRLLEYLRSSLSHPYKTIRDRIGNVLTGIFMYGLVLPGGAQSQYPSCSDFIKEILPQLSPLMQEPSSSATHDLDSDMTKYEASMPFAPVESAISQPEDKMFSAVGMPSERDLGRTLARSDDFVKVLGDVALDHSKVSVLSSLVSQVPSLDRDSCLAGRDGKELSKLGKIKLEESGDLSSDVLYRSVGVMPPESVSFERDNIHEMCVKSQVNGYRGGSKEKKRAVRLMNTVCHWLLGQIGRSYNGFIPEIYKFLPYLCELESVDNDLELRGNCMATLSVLSQGLVLPHRIPSLIFTITQIAQSSWWRARAAILSVLQVVVFTNMFTILNDKSALQQVQDLVVGLLSDPRLEVQQVASTALSGLVHCKIIQAEDNLLNEFTCKLQQSQNQSRRRNLLQPQEVTELHANVLGLCAYVSAFPYDLPDMLPQVLVTLSDHLSDPHPIPATIKKTLSNFWRTHHDNWRDHKKKFTEDQLFLLTDLLLSPSYYA